MTYKELSLALGHPGVLCQAEIFLAELGQGADYGCQCTSRLEPADADPS